MRKATRIFLVRHGRTRDNLRQVLQGHTDISLDEVGIKEAGLVAKRLSSLKFDFIYSSTLKRAAETAAIIAKHHNCKVIHSKLLMERSFGELEGKPYPEDGRFWINQRLRPPMGESLYDVLKRVRPLLDSILEKHKGKTILIVSHGTMGRVILCYFLKIHLTNTSLFRAKNASITEIEFENDEPHLIRFNDHAHLE